jgi:hypothetical protein
VHWNADLDKPEYLLADLAKVTALPIGTVKMWIERRILRMDTYDKSSRGKGSVRVFTLRTVMVAATMAEITKIGVTPSKAAMWAHMIWRTPFLEEGQVPRDEAVFIGNPNSDDWRIARREALSAELIFGDAVPDDMHRAPQSLSAVVIDVAALAQKCVAELTGERVNTESLDGYAQT